MYSRACSFIFKPSSCQWNISRDERFAVRQCRWSWVDFGRWRCSICSSVACCKEEGGWWRHLVVLELCKSFTALYVLLLWADVTIGGKQRRRMIGTKTGTKHSLEAAVEYYKLQIVHLIKTWIYRSLKTQITINNIHLNKFWNTKGFVTFFNFYVSFLFSYTWNICIHTCMVQYHEGACIPYTAMCTICICLERHRYELRNWNNHMSEFQSKKYKA